HENDGSNLHSPESKEHRGIHLRRLPVNQHDALFVINLVQPHFDDFGVAGLHRAPDELSFDGHFAVAAVNQNAKSDALRAAEVEKTIHSRANSAAGVKHVVNENEVHAVDGKGNVGGLQHGLRRDLRKVIAIKSNVQRADGNVHAVNAAHSLGDALGKGHTP